MEAGTGRRIRVVETGEIFETQSACAKKLGITPSAISDCLAGRKKSYRGYTFERVKD